MTQLQETAQVDHTLLLAEIPRLATQFEVFRFMKRLTEQFRLKAFMVFKVPVATTQELQTISVITNWPSELLAKYDAANLLQNSPLMENVRTSTVPFSIDYETPGPDPEDERRKTISLLFRQHGLVRGAGFPVCDAQGERGCIGFSGTREVVTDYEMLQLHMLSTHVFDRLYQIGRKDIRGGDELTEREVDCLNWTAAGKTSAEISEILGLSEHTVNHYLNRATKKLDTVNRTQAVAKALRMGIIS